MKNTQERIEELVDLYITACTSEEKRLKFQALYHDLQKRKPDPKKWNETDYQELERIYKHMTVQQ